MTNQLDCDHQFTIVVKAIFEIPFENIGHLTKKDMRKKENILWGADWENDRVICKKCGINLDLLIMK